MSVSPRRAAGALPALAALLILLLVFAASPARAQDGSVSIAGLAFAPASVSVNTGGTVTWTHQDGSIPHTVTANNGAFGSGQLTNGQTFSHTFTSAGTFAYFCTIHPEMTGTVVVAAAGGGGGGTGTTPAAGTTPGSGGGTAPPAVGTGLAGADGGAGQAEFALAGGTVAVLFAGAASIALSRRRR